MKYRVSVERTEIYTADCVVDAESAEAAKATVEQLLEQGGGWDAVFPGDDGEYTECFSEVTDVATELELAKSFSGTTQAAIVRPNPS